MSPQLALRALLEVNRMFIAEQREINAAIISSYLGIAMSSSDGCTSQAVPVAEMAERIGLPPSTLYRHIAYLGSGPRAEVPGLGLVETFPDPEDGRSKLVKLTLKGEAFMGRWLRAIG